MAKFIVTGGGGFVGRALCRRLVEMGHEVISVSRSNYPELENLGAGCAVADLGRDLNVLKRVFQGAKAVFHTAAKVDMWGPYQDFYASNVLGTRNVLQACREAGVPNLIFTSSPSVIACGGDLEGVNESVPYPAKHQAAYPATKAIAEREVLAANQPGVLATVALRPHLIFGPGDNHLAPTILNRARAGRLLRVGDGKNLSDFTFIDDCIDAHLCALKALESGGEVGGRAYFISQSDPVPLWGWIDTLLELNGAPPVARAVSKRSALAIAGVMEIVSKLFGTQPLFTRFLICEMTTHHYFDISAARDQLGFQPKYGVIEALRATYKEGPKEGLRSCG